MENCGKCTNEKNFINCFFILFPANLNAENISKVYFAGGCFWCMEESFDKVNGVIKQFLDILVDMLKTLNTKMLLKTLLAIMKR